MEFHSEVLTFSSDARVDLAASADWRAEKSEPTAKMSDLTLRANQVRPTANYAAAKHEAWTGIENSFCPSVLDSRLFRSRFSLPSQTP